MHIIRETFAKFFADRGTHLAAMIAYFALLSFVPLLFLALALLGLSGRADESSYFVTELKKIFPGASIASIVAVIRTIQRQRHLARDRRRRVPALVVALALQRAGVGVQHRLRPAQPAVPPRQGRASCFMLARSSSSSSACSIGGIGAHALNRFAPGFLGNTIVAYASRCSSRRSASSSSSSRPTAT